LLFALVAHMSLNLAEPCELHEILGQNLKYIQVMQRNLIGRESTPLLCREVLYWAGDSVALAIGLHRFHFVVVGRPRLEVVQVHAENCL
jgi:hypothetical protein